MIDISYMGFKLVPCCILGENAHLYKWKRCSGSCDLPGILQAPGHVAVGIQAHMDQDTKI